VDQAEFLRRIPKAELHCHLEGSVRPDTLAELAGANAVPLPAADPAELYRYEDLDGFLEIYGLVCRTLVRREDFSRVAYESLEDGVRLGNLRYREMFFNPTLHTRYGISYPDIIDGLVQGIHDAESDFGVVCRLIPSIYRQDELDVAEQMLDEMLAHRPDEVIGLGMDGDEMQDLPEKFAYVFRRAGREGLRLTAHTAHDGPSVLITTCLDALGVERIDHGYHVLDDGAVLARARDEGVPFACSPGCPPLCGWPAELSRSPIKAMIDSGLKVSIHSDDPTMLHADIGTVYVQFCSEFGFGVDQARELCLTAVDSAWLDAEASRRMRREFEAEIDVLEGELEAARRSDGRNPAATAND
jgi:adenosine deaminase